jgi:peptidoglycan hydrolase CwlO-like protein
MDSKVMWEIIKILLGIIGGIIVIAGGAYIGSIVKSIKTEIMGLKDLLMVHIEEIKLDIAKLQNDIKDLYTLTRNNEKDITQAKTNIKNLEKKDGK